MIGNIVRVIVDRPLGSRHPKHKDIIYTVNYGYIPGVIAPDGEEQDAYILGVNEPIRILYPFRSHITNKEAEHQFCFFVLRGDGARSA